MENQKLNRAGTLPDPRESPAASSCHAIENKTRYGIKPILI